MDLITAVITDVAQHVDQIADRLAPIGHGMTVSFIIVGIVLFGLSVAFAPTFLAPLAEFLMWGSLLQGTAGAMFRQFLIAIAAPLIAVGIAIPGILALMAQLTLVVGAAAGPIIVPGLAFHATRPLAFGVCTYLISATLRVITLGLISVLFANAIVDHLAVPGTDAVIGVADIVGLLLTSAFAMVVGFGANSIAGQLVGHGVGALGLSSFARPLAAVTNISTVAGTAATAASGAVKAGGGAAGSALGGAARAITRSGGRGGSAF
jgi:hypothetical protein